jgi:hypothetical protein
MAFERTSPDLHVLPNAQVSMGLTLREHGDTVPQSTKQAVEHDGVQVVATAPGRHQSSGEARLPEAVLSSRGLDTERVRRPVDNGPVSYGQCEQVRSEGFRTLSASKANTCGYQWVTSSAVRVVPGRVPRFFLWQSQCEQVRSEGFRTLSASKANTCGYQWVTSSAVRVVPGRVPRFFLWQSQCEQVRSEGFRTLSASKGRHPILLPVEQGSGLSADASGGTK